MPARVKGPHLKTAAFFTAVAKDSWGLPVLSGLVSRVMIHDGPNTKAAAPPSPILVVIVDAGESYGSYLLSVDQEAPGGKTQRLFDARFKLRAEEQQFMRATQTYQLAIDGTHWFHLELNGAPWASVPFRVVRFEGGKPS